MLSDHHGGGASRTERSAALSVAEIRWKTSNGVDDGMKMPRTWVYQWCKAGRRDTVEDEEDASGQEEEMSKEAEGGTVMLRRGVLRYDFRMC